MLDIKNLSHVFLCVPKTGLFLVYRIIIRQIPSLCDCDEFKRVERYSTTCRKAESDNYLLRISGKSRPKEHLTHLEEQYLKSLEFPLLISIGIEKKEELMKFGDIYALV